MGIMGLIGLRGIGVWGGRKEGTGEVLINFMYSYIIKREMLRLYIVFFLYII